MPRHPEARVVLGVGPRSAKVMLVGEAPGREENYKGRPFVGKAGEVLTALLAFEGIDRKDCYITNLVKYWPGERNPDPDEADIQRDLPLLESELREVRPKFIITLGRHSTRYFLGYPLTMELANGLAFRSPLSKQAVILPVTHPAAGLHDPRLATDSYLGMRAACKFIREPGEVWGQRAVEHTWESPSRQQLVFRDPVVDTEGTPDSPFSLQVTVAGKHYFLPASAASKARLLGTLRFHNAKYDVRMLNALGTEYQKDARHWEDSMVLAYVRQDQPQGLKALAFRLLQEPMQSFDELVQPHFDQLACQYLERLVQAKDQFERPEPSLILDGKWRYYRPQHVSVRAASMLRSWGKTKDTDLEAGWQKILPAEREKVEKLLGPFPRRGIECVPADEAARYATYDTAATARLGEVYACPKELRAIYRLDVESIPALVEMEETGMPFSREAAHRLHLELQEEIKELRGELRKLAGDPWLNPGSTQQIGRVLESWGVSSPRTTKGSGAESWDDRSLSMVKLLTQHDESKGGRRTNRFVSLLQDYRERVKLDGTYVAPDALPSKIDKLGYIHPTLKHTRTATGRLSSEDPNLQNIPNRTELGRRVRQCFVVEQGCLLSADYSQIELRLTAHESEDPRMLEVYRTGQDLHRLTEKEVFGVPDEQAGSKRSGAKNFNFRVVYAGKEGSPLGLREQLFLDGVDLSEDECRRYRDRWFQLYEGVGRYLDRKATEARMRVYVSTAGGRRRYLPMIRLDAVRSAQNEAIRQAGNHGIQGGAAEVIKRAMVLWDRKYREQVCRIAPTKLIMQIHDELLFLVMAEGEKVKKIAALVREMMQADSAKYRVPILAETKAGRVWGMQESVK